MSEAHRKLGHNDLSPPSSPRPTYNEHDVAPPSANIYSPLQEGQIRLVQLLRHDSGDLSCRMISTDFHTAPPYFALSYVCGDGNNSCCITVNELPVAIKPNLFDALQRLVRYFRALDVFSPFIWIDAISINQYDLEEKASQVRNMHIVFSNATEVLVWFGHVSSDVQMAMLVLNCIQDFFVLRMDFPWAWLERDLFSTRSPDDSISRLGPGKLHEDQRKAVIQLARRTRLLEEQYALPRTQLFTLFGFLTKYRCLDRTDDACVMGGHTARVRCMLDDHPIIKEKLPARNHSLWTGLLALPHCEWFKRIWTYQEIMLARNATIFTSTTYIALEWSALIDCEFMLLKAISFGELLRCLPTPLRSTRASGAQEFFERSINSFLVLVPLRLDEVRYTSAIDYLFFAANRKATVAKDYVYSVLGLLDANIRANIKVDYTMTDAAVFAHAMKVVLDDSPAAIRMIWIEDFNRTLASPMPDGLPTWCPNLQSKRSHVSTLTLHNTIFSDTLRAKFFPRAKYQNPPGSPTLGINILELDRVAQCMSTPFPFDEAAVVSKDADYNVLFGKLATWVSELQELFGNDLEVCASGIDRDNDILKLLGMNSDRGMKLLAAASVTSTSGSREHLTDDGLDFYHKSVVEDCLPFYLVHERFLFKTVSGKVGFCTDRAVVGGLIVLVPHCENLQMLSLHGTEYMGCATVHGLKDDTLLALAAELEDKWRMVYLN